MNIKNLDLTVPDLYNNSYVSHLADMPYDDLGICIEYLAGEQTHQDFLECLRQSSTEPYYILNAYRLLPEAQSKLFFIIDLWNNQERYQNFKAIWSILFREISLGGEMGGLLFQAGFSSELIQEMYSQTLIENLMKDNELNYFNELPKEVEIWRVVTPFTEYEWKGVNWYLKYESAYNFADRAFSDDCFILYGKINKEHIMTLYLHNKDTILKPWQTSKIKKINKLKIS